MNPPRLLRYAAQPISLRENRPHAFAAEFALGLFRRNAIYSFIPKNACSTMRYSLARENGVISRDDQIGWIHDNNGTFRASLADLVRADYSFVVLRSPYDRLVSCFLDKFAGAESPAKDFVRRHKVGLGEISFARFVRTLAEGEEVRANAHWRPQADFLVYEEYDDWFALERFPEAVRRLAERIGFTVYDARDLTGHGTERLERIGAPGEFAEATVKTIRKMERTGRVPSLTSLYSPELVALVDRLYADDLGLYRRHCGELPPP